MNFEYPKNINHPLSSKIVFYLTMGDSVSIIVAEKLCKGGAE